MAEEHLSEASPVETPETASPAATTHEADEGLGQAPEAFALAPMAPEDKKKKKNKKDKKKASGTTLGTSRGIETMFRTSYRVNMDLSALADTKSNMIMGVNSIVISIVLAGLSSKIDANTWLLIPTSVLLVGCLISLVYAILAARPRVASTAITLEDVRQNNANILFFGNFAHMSREDYVQGMTELLQNTDNLYYNMIVDIYGLGGVLQKKFRLLRTAYTTLMFAVVLGVLSFVLVYILIAFSPSSVPLGP